MTTFPFYDLKSFREFVVFASACLPDRFPERSGRLADEPWTLDRVFEGLHKGIVDALGQSEEKDDLLNCGTLVDRAYQAYKDGRLRDGQSTLKHMDLILERIITAR